MSETINMNYAQFEKLMESRENDGKKFFWEFLREAEKLYSSLEDYKWNKVLEESTEENVKDAYKVLDNLNLYKNIFDKYDQNKNKFRLDYEKFEEGIQRLFKNLKDCKNTDVITDIVKEIPEANLDLGIEIDEVIDQFKEIVDDINNRSSEKIRLIEGAL